MCTVILLRMWPGQEIWLSHHKVGSEKGLVSGGIHPRMNGDREGRCRCSKTGDCRPLDSIRISESDRRRRHKSNLSGILSLTRLALQDGGLEAGHIVLAGSFTRTVAVNPGDVFTANYGALGALAVAFD